MFSEILPINLITSTCNKIIIKRIIIKKII